MSYLGRVTRVVGVALVVASGAAEAQAAVAAGKLSDQLTYKSPTNSKSRTRSVVVGHNVTPSALTPKKGVWTVGNYAVGVGITDNIFLATSPWVWTSYNTANIHLKFSAPVSRKARVGFFASYFESFDSTQFLVKQPTGLHASTLSSKSEVADTNRYQWQSASAHLLSSVEASDSITVNFNAHYAYFWNDDFPYSIRMDPGRDSLRGQVDLSTLTEVKVADSEMSWLFELGALGVNYAAPYLQVGSSLVYKDQSWLVQFGASYTVAFNEARYQTGWSPGRYDSRTHYTADGQAYRQRYLQTALHPEVQLQYFF